MSPPLRGVIIALLIMLMWDWGLRVILLPRGAPLFRENRVVPLVRDVLPFGPTVHGLRILSYIRESFLQLDSWRTWDHILLFAFDTTWYKLFYFLSFAFPAASCSYVLELPFQERKSMGCGQNSWIDFHNILGWAKGQYQDFLCSLGFWDFLSISPSASLSFCLGALWGRYFAETGTFHLSTLELAPSPLDWSVILGILMGGDILPSVFWWVVTFYP